MPVTKDEVNAYAKQHNLEEELSKVVNEAIASKSPSPIAFISSLLATKISDKAAIDWSAVRQELLFMMDNPSWDDGSLAPIFIRLAWHSSGTYDKATGTGGSNGAGMRFATEAADPENAGLHSARAFLEPIKRRFPAISYSDLWVLAAYVGIEHTGGPAIAFTPGRSDHVDEAYWARMSYGRLPAAEKYCEEGLDEEGRPKGWRELCKYIREEIFGRMGFGDREIVALLTGGHMYGRCHPTSSGYAGAWVEEPTKFSNEYAVDMIGDEWRMVDATDTWLDAQGAAELRPAPGRRQYVNKKPPSEVVMPDASEYPPGEYVVSSGWVNVRKDPDTKSDIIGQPVREQKLNLVAIKMFGTAVRGRLDTSGWVSIIATGGKVLFERVGDLQLRPGTYRLENGASLYTDPTVPLGSAVDRVDAGSVELEEVRLVDDFIFGKAAGGWLPVMTPDGGVVADRIEAGFNDATKPADEFEDPPAPNQMMLLSDMVLAWDESFRAVLQQYADDEGLLKVEFGAAFKKLTELGCPFTPSAAA